MELVSEKKKKSAVNFEEFDDTITEADIQTFKKRYQELRMLQILSRTSMITIIFYMTLMTSIKFLQMGLLVYMSLGMLTRLVGSYNAMQELRGYLVIL